MYPKLLHLYGPLEINSFNASIIVGIAIFFYAALRHPGLEKWISKSDFFNISVESAIAGIVGGRVLHILSEWKDYTSFYQMISIWNGGLSLFGAFAGVFFYSLWALKRKQLPVLVLYDVAALYAPLIQGMGRIGCFLAGCCYGCPTSLSWGITYTHPLVVAPLNTQIHPTQLYSSLIFFGIFIVMRFFVFKHVSRAGELSMMYVMAMSFERWFVDFFRGDRIMLPNQHPFSFFSFHQWNALFIFISACIVLVYLRSAHRRVHESV